MSSRRLSQERSRFFSWAMHRVYAGIHFIEPNSRMNGYDAGFEKDEYDCNLDKCECQNFDQFVIGKVLIHWLSRRENDKFR